MSEATLLEPRPTLAVCLLTLIFGAAVAAAAADPPFEVDLAVVQKAAGDLELGVSWEVQEVGAVFISVQASPKLATPDARELLEATSTYAEQLDRAAKVETVRPRYQIGRSVR